MLAHQDAVEPHRGEVIHRAETEEIDGLFTDQALRLAPAEAAAVPGQAGVVTQIRKLCLPGAWDLNRPQVGTGQRRRIERAGGIDGELPVAVEREALSQAGTSVKAERRAAGNGIAIDKLGLSPVFVTWVTGTTGAPTPPPRTAGALALTSRVGLVTAARRVTR